MVKNYINEYEMSGGYPDFWRSFLCSCYEPQNTSKDRIIFAYDLEIAQFSVNEFEPELTGNNISIIDLERALEKIDNLTGTITTESMLKLDKQYCRYQCCLIATIVGSCIVCNAYEIRIKKMQKLVQQRNDELIEVLTTINKDLYDTKEWHFRSGKHGGWIEQVRNGTHAEHYVMNENHQMYYKCEMGDHPKKQSAVHDPTVENQKRLDDPLHLQDPNWGIAEEQQKMKISVHPETEEDNHHRDSRQDLGRSSKHSQRDTAPRVNPFEKPVN